MFSAIDQTCVNALRALSIDMTNRASSGHPGLPLDAAPMAYVLWAKHIRQNPKDAKWPNRDRFVLSPGHGSALLYALLHLSGYDLSLDDLKSFRQLGSKTPGHPEVGLTDGVEATTGPLGQGFTNAVGMAMAEAHDAAVYNTTAHKVVDHYTYALVSDGDLMEGLTQEAASLAGHLKLGKLIMLYDSNDISLDGPTALSFTENVGQRFQAYGWQYLLVEDGNDLESINQAVEAGKANLDQPTLIEVKTVIGYGSEHEGTNSVHGSPLGREDGNHAKAVYGWNYEEFEVPDQVYDRFKEAVADRGQAAEESWQQEFQAYQADEADLAGQFKRTYAGELPQGWADSLPTYEVGDEAMATRKSSQAAIQAIAKAVPEFWGGSADLFTSNNTQIKADQAFQADNYHGRNIYFGVREHAMGGIVNGIMLHGGSRPYASTFFVFSDYMKGAMRVASLSGLPVIYVFTHDSIAVGEDGPTHEPIEQLATFRATPNLQTIRPADGNEVSAAWEVALETTDRPTVLVLSRQSLPVLEGTKEKARQGVKRGAYVLSPADGPADGILIATGSEVQLAVQAQAELAKDHINVAVVSMPSQERFEEQSQEYKESVLPSNIRNRITIEMASPLGWERYAGDQGVVMGINRFGASGKGSEVVASYGFTVDNIVRTYKENFS